MKIRQLFNRILSLLLVFTVILGSSTIYADAKDPLTNLTSCKNWPSEPSVEAECAILIEAKTGAILYGKNINETCYPASITKVMTGLLTLERCSRDEELTFSYRATHELEPGSTHIARTEGEVMTVNDCLYALLLQSANEVAQGLAEHVSGSIEDFAVEMTKRAKELGCTNTSFTNPSGLNDENHYTTCHDMAIIMKAAIENPDFLEIDSTLTYTIPVTNKHEESLPIAMKHQMLKQGANHYDGAIAGKTGYTTLAGHTLVTYAQRGDLDLICVIMKSNNTHYTDTAALLDYGFNKFTMQHLSDTDALTTLKDTASAAGVSGLDRAYIPDDQWLVLPKNLDFAELTTEAKAVSGREDGAAAVMTYSHKGTDLGSATLLIAEPETSSDSQEVSPEEEDTSAKEDSILGTLKDFIKKLHPSRWMKSLKELVKPETLKEHAFKLILAVVGILVLIIIFVKMSSRGRRRRRRASYSSPSGFGKRSRKIKRHGRRRRFK